MRHIAVIVCFNAFASIAFADVPSPEVWTGSRVCAVEKSWLVKADGSGMGAWTNAPKSFRLALKTCSQIEADASKAFGLTPFHDCARSEYSAGPPPREDEILGEVRWALKDVEAMGSGIALRRGNKNMFGNLNWQFVLVVNQDEVHVTQYAQVDNSAYAWFSLNAVCYAD